jgi:hypothetical protein
MTKLLSASDNLASLKNINKRQILWAHVTVSKHPGIIALSNHILEKIDKEVTREKRSRSEMGRTVL